MKSTRFLTVSFSLVIFTTPYFSSFSQERPYFSEEEINEKIDPYILEKSRRCVENWHIKNDAFIKLKPGTPVKLVYDNSFEESMEFSLEPSLIFSPNVQDVIVFPVFLASSISSEINDFNSSDDCQCCRLIISCCKAGGVD